MVKHGSLAMYVCLCNALREHEVDQAISQGRRTPEEVYAALGVERQCGSCACEIDRRIEDLSVERAA
ncbi:MAG: (2Fe-2S)-binding protein [Alphaproteobacteria bacterium]